MGRMIKAILREGVREQRGYVYILVLLFLVLGGLMIAPLLDFMGTGLESGHLVFEPKTGELYAADAGIDDAIWQIKYENISSSQSPVTGYDEYGYYKYDPVNYEWGYDLSDPVNDESVSVTIRNVWVPENISAPSPSEARDIIEGTDEAGCRIRVNGSATASSEYRIRIDIIPQEDWDLKVHSIGIWLPSGFSYVDGSSNLESLGYSADVDPYAGGEAVIWDLGSTVFSDLPPAWSQESAIVEFEYTSEAAREMVTISWIETENLGAGVQIPFSWDDDMKVFALTSSAAGGTTIESNIYLSASYSSLLDNAITSPGSINTQPSTTVNGIIECPLDGFDEPDNGDWEHQEYNEDWPDTEEWRQFFWDDVNLPPPPPEQAPDPGSPVDLKVYDDDDDLIGPWYRPNDLNVNNTQPDLDTMILNGTIYVGDGAGGDDCDLNFAQPGEPKAYTIDLNYNTIFAEGEIDSPSDKITLTGSGCIIAIGDIFFHPNIESGEGDFIFVCSLEGTVTFNPGGTFHGSVAGQEVVGMQPGTGITWTPPPGGLNLPGMGGSGTGGFGSSITKYTWKIE